MIKEKFEQSKIAFSYGGIVLVVFLWGVAPLITVKLFDFYSPCIMKAVGGFVCTIALLLFFRKKLKLINKDYLKVALPTGFFYATAEIIQKIGLKFTTPTISAFLENLSCITVPILMYFFIKQKPTFLKIVACIVCLFSVFVLNMTGNTFSIGIGEILCALAGLFYGVNIAGTGAFAKKLDTGLYILIQTIVLTVLSIVVTIVLNFVKLPNAQTVIEPIKFSFNILHIFFLILTYLIMTVFCWLVRTSALKNVDATVVSVIMPFSAIITGISSVIVGYDKISLNLVLGGVLGFVAILISSLGDTLEVKKRLKNHNAT